ncbi:unnamed protein product [Moneuplotes crassus]|uniref:Uncharacterized protein n=2 Tax=Euplotes crassus TaxID=5936 RepID=A0AAD1X6D8_EUPCR|nr:unnamed protein product [Moneuplotes crassus]
MDSLKRGGKKVFDKIIRGLNDPRRINVEEIQKVTASIEQKVLQKVDKLQIDLALEPVELTKVIEEEDHKLHLQEIKYLNKISPQKVRKIDIKKLRTHLSSSMTSKSIDRDGTCSSGSQKSLNKIPPHEEIMKRVKKNRSERQKRLLSEQKKQQKQEQEALLERERRRQEEDAMRQKRYEQLEIKIKEKQKERKQQREAQEKEYKERIRKIRSVEPAYKKMANKYRQEVELPEIREKMARLRDMKYDVYHYKPNNQELNHHSKIVENEIKVRLQESVERRAQEMRKQARTHAHLKTHTQVRVKMQDDLVKILREEQNENKQRMLKKRKEFGNVINKLYKPTISLKKKTEMEKLIKSAQGTSVEDIPKIKYERPKDSILNKEQVESIDKRLDPETIDYYHHQSEHNSSTAANDEHFKTLAFSKRDFMEEHSPSRAYAPREELHPVKEKPLKRRIKKSHTRSRSSLDTASKRGYKGSYLNMSPSRNPGSKNFNMALDYLAERRRKRKENPSKIEYKESIPKILVGDKLSAVRNILTEARRVEKIAEKYEQNGDKNIRVTDIGKENTMVGMIYADSILAKAAILEQL